MVKIATCRLKSKLLCALECRIELMPARTKPVRDRSDSGDCEDARLTNPHGNGMQKSFYKFVN